MIEPYNEPIFDALNVRDKLVVLRVENVSKFIGQTQETLAKIQEVLKNNGANSVIVLPRSIDIETYSDDDLLKMGLVRIVSDFCEELKKI